MKPPRTYVAPEPFKQALEQRLKSSSMSGAERHSSLPSWAGRTSRTARPRGCDRSGGPCRHAPPLLSPGPTSWGPAPSRASRHAPVSAKFRRSRGPGPWRRTRRRPTGPLQRDRSGGPCGEAPDFCRVESLAPRTTEPRPLTVSPGTRGIRTRPARGRGRRPARHAGARRSTNRGRVAGAREAGPVERAFLNGADMPKRATGGTSGPPWV